jgi:hypothetical protein
MSRVAQAAITIGSWVAARYTVEYARNSIFLETLHIPVIKPTVQPGKTTLLIK